MQIITRLFLVFMLAGCTSPHTEFLPNSLSPIAVGDDIVLHPKGSGPDVNPKALRVTAIGPESISGESVDDGGAILTYRWDAIRSIEYRQFDSGKTTGLVLLGALLLYAADQFADGLEDLFGKSGD